MGKGMGFLVLCVLIVLAVLQLITLLTVLDMRPQSGSRREVGRSAGTSSASTSEEVRRGPDLAALAQIRLPENATRDEVTDYVQKILAASANQNAYSSNDPQVAMLATVGKKYPDILMQECAAYRKAGSGMAGWAFMSYLADQVVGPDDKQLVIQYLDTFPELCGSVVRYGWQKDARNALIGGLKKYNVGLPDSWFLAAASLDDPVADQAMVEYLKHGANPVAAFSVLQSRPGVDLEAAVDAAWQASADYGPWARLQAALIAVAYGHKDALPVLAADLGSDELSEGPSEARNAILKCTEARGSNAELRTWVQKNYGKLKWDATGKVFRAPPKP